MKRFIHIFLFCAPLFFAGVALTLLPLSVQAESLPGATQTMDVATAVNLTGRQRMLSQRMVKAYLMLGQGIATDDARRILQQSIDQFESQLAALKTFQPNQQVQSALARLDTEWTKFKLLIVAPPNKEGAAALYDANEALQKAAHNATLACEDVTMAPLDHLVNIAGRERMLTQRMAKFFFYRTWNLYIEPAGMEMVLSRAHFTAVLIQIESSPYVTTRTKELAAKIRRDWEPYYQALFMSQAPDNMRSNAQRVAELSEQLLTETEELVALIVEHARQK